MSDTKEVSLADIGWKQDEEGWYNFQWNGKRWLDDCAFGTDLAQMILETLQTPDNFDTELHEDDLPDLVKPEHLRRAAEVCYELGLFLSDSMTSEDLSFPADERYVFALLIQMIADLYQVGPEGFKAHYSKPTE